MHITFEDAEIGFFIINEGSQSKSRGTGGPQVSSAFRIMGLASDRTLRQGSFLAVGRLCFRKPATFISNLLVQHKDLDFEWYTVCKCLCRMFVASS